MAATQTNFGNYGIFKDKYSDAHIAITHMLRYDNRVHWSKDGKEFHPLYPCASGTPDRTSSTDYAYYYIRRNVNSFATNALRIFSEKGLLVVTNDKGKPVRRRQRIERKPLHETSFKNCKKFMQLEKNDKKLLFKAIECGEITFIPPKMMPTYLYQAGDNLICFAINPANINEKTYFIYDGSTCKEKDWTNYLELMTEYTDSNGEVHPLEQIDDMWVNDLSVFGDTIHHTKQPSLAKYLGL